MDIQGVGVLVRNPQGQIAVFHRTDRVLESGKWGLTGGRVRENLGKIQSAIYKAKSEAGLDFQQSDLKHLGEFKFVDSTGNDNTFNVWVADIGDRKIILRDEGCDAFKWEDPQVLIKQDNLMAGMYPILRKFNEARVEPPQLPPN